MRNLMYANILEISRFSHWIQWVTNDPQVTSCPGEWVLGTYAQDLPSMAWGENWKGWRRKQNTMGNAVVDAKAWSQGSQFSVFVLQQRLDWFWAWVWVDLRRCKYYVQRPKRHNIPVVLRLTSWQGMKWASHTGNQDERKNKKGKILHNVYGLIMGSTNTNKQTTCWVNSNVQMKAHQLNHWTKSLQNVNLRSRAKHASPSPGTVLCQELDLSPLALYLAKIPFQELLLMMHLNEFLSK